MTPFSLEALLPHRAPMILLTRVIDHNDEHAAALVQISNSVPFFDPALNGVPAWVGVEYMAQTIGLWAGHQQLSRGKPVQAGFLLGCRSYTCNRAVFPAGCTLRLSATVIYNDNSGLGAFDCEIRSDDILARAQIKAFRPENPHDFMRPFSLPAHTGNPA